MNFVTNTLLCVSLHLSLELFRSKAKWHCASDRTMIILSKAGRDSQKKISFRLTSRSMLFLFVGTVTAATTTTATTATRYTVARVWFAVRRGTAATTFTTTGIFAALAAGGARVARTAGLFFPHFLPDMILLHFLILFLTETQHNDAWIRFIDLIQIVPKLSRLISRSIFKNMMYSLCSSIFFTKKEKHYCLK